ncbi:unnamed protein product (macronuclear) [Paramecium tetraurelia]|uniref:Protein kinase domain-containing protein n=1 Tax=Paramecium tetraurelia TaxID=5888 RepID=A0EGK3_PARTE|nr:uncharacterized protein GSPATT00026768001 [Paramecium tetraurelia]CAK94444.1 unnamed protein product [Paramecium tetraurelia]|eukprot:XP_001461817.1 hypothetical protein (macronuclear) [Paramecium tetraurelia strain d4-2]
MNQESIIFNLLQCQEYLLDEQQIKYTKEQQLQKVKDLVANLIVKYKSFVNQIEIEDQVYLITIPMEVHNQICTIQFELLLNFKCNENDYRVILTDSSGRIIVKEKNIRISLSRYMLRLNTGLRIGSFYIHPLNGYIGFKLQCQSEQGLLFYQTESDYYKFINYLDTLIETALYSVRFHFLRIMILINRIDIKQIQIYEKYMMMKRYPEIEKIEWRKFPQDIIPLLQRIKNTSQTNLNETYNNEQYKKYGPIISKSMITENKIINQIKVDSPSDLQVEEKHEINSGGFSIIYGKDITYQLDKNQEKNIMKRHFAIKLDKSPETNKIKKEIKILQTLAQEFEQDEQKGQMQNQEFFKFTGKCPYIAQFYYVPENTDILLMERYYYSSLDNFSRRQEEFLSMSTKIFLAHSVAMGLRYCHNYNIIHMDIKPANILISKALVAKISDFGEAISTKGNQQNQKVGRSMPYCAPEMLNPNWKENFTPAYDIFSFGVLLFELLFERHPIDFRYQNIKILEDKYQRQTYSVRVNIEEDKRKGPQKIMKYLLNLCLACLQPDPKCRPNIDKIVLILKDSLSYMDKMY